MRLICFPYAGGSASVFVPLSAALWPDIEVIAVQYPGRQDRMGETPLDGIIAIADRVADLLEPWIASPFAFFGHSMGAMVAFETTRLLRRRGGPAPMTLFASARRAPSAGLDRIRDLDDDSLIAELTELCGTDPAVIADPDLLRIILPTVRADFRAVQEYRYVPTTPGPDLECPVVAVLGDRDPLVSADQAAVWATHTAKDCSVHVLEGDHFYLVPRLPQLADLVRSQCLRRSLTQ